MACSILDYIPYGNGRIGVFECSIVSGIPIYWSSSFLDPLDKMPLVARGHVTYLILNYWTQPTNPKDWNSITQKSDSVKCDFMVVWMTQKIRCINGKVAGSCASWSYIFFLSKTFLILQVFQQPKYLSLCLSHLKINFFHPFSISSLVLFKLYPIFLA